MTPTTKHTGAKSVKKTARKKVEFQLVAMPGSRASVVGTFNNWNTEKNPMAENSGSGRYTAVIALPPGKHEYKFVVDGEWSADPTRTECVLNAHGTLNSVVCVQA